MLEKDKIGLAILDQIEPLGSVESERFNPNANVKSLSLLLEGFKNQISQEREFITAVSGQLIHATQQFESYLTQFESFEKACKRGLVESLKSELNYSIRKISTTIAEEVAAHANEPIKQSLDSLCQLNLKMKERYQDQKRSWRRFSALLLIAALLSGTVSGLLVHHFTAPKKEVKVKLRAGEILMRSWSKLTKQEQEKIMNLGIGNRVS